MQATQTFQNKPTDHARGITQLGILQPPHYIQEGSSEWRARSFKHSKTTGNILVFNFTYHQQADKTNLFHMRGGRFHAGNTLCTFKFNRVTHFLASTYSVTLPDTNSWGISWHSLTMTLLRNARRRFYSLMLIKSDPKRDHTARLYQQSHDKTTSDVRIGGKIGQCDPGFRPKPDSDWRMQRDFLQCNSCKKSLESSTLLKNCGAHTQQRDPRCPLYAGAILADSFNIIAVTSCDVPLK